MEYTDTLRLALVVVFFGPPALVMFASVLAKAYDLLVGTTDEYEP